MDAMIEKLHEGVAAFGPNLIGALLILILGWWAARILTGVLRRGMERGGVEAALVSFVGNLVYLLVLTLVAIAALGRLGVNTTSFAAVVAAAGLAIGFALQGSLANFAAGVMIIVFRPFKVGDYVEAGGVSGSIEEIQVFQTILKTPDNRRVFVPNNAITGDAITNYSANDTRRLDLVFGISYGDDIKLAKDVIDQILDADDRVLAEPARTVAVLALGDSSVDIAVRPWVRTADYWPVLFDLTERIKLEFDARGITIPFPQRDVHLMQAAA